VVAEQRLGIEYGFTPGKLENVVVLRLPFARPPQLAELLVKAPLVCGQAPPHLDVDTQVEVAAGAATEAEQVMCQRRMPDRVACARTASAKGFP